MQKRSGKNKAGNRFFWKKPGRVSLGLLWSYLVIIMAPAIAIMIIYCTMENALLDVQQEKAINLLAESASTLDRELDQIVHVIGQITEDDEVLAYMENIGSVSGAESYYRSYELAVNFPDYRLTNQFIKNIYIFPVNGEYIMQMPRVIPNTSRGIGTMSALSDQKDYEGLLSRLSNLDEKRAQGLFCLENPDGSTSLIMIQEVVAEDTRERTGYVMAELDEDLVEDLLDRTLSGDRGIAYLSDSEGRILLLSDHLGEEKSAWLGLTGEEYLSGKGWKPEKLAVVRESLDYNQWKLVSGITNTAMINRIGMVRYATLLLCSLSILIGIGICMRYWWSSWPVIKKYEKLQAKYETGNIRGGMNGLWKRFGGVMDRMEELEKTVEHQAEWARQGILRKLLYGNYDTQQELEAEISRMGVTLPLEFPCLVAVMKVGELMKQETSLTEEEIHLKLMEHIEEVLPSNSQIIKMDPLTYALLLPGQSDKSAARQMFEEINYEFYSRIPLGIYMGISDGAQDIMEISTEYEKAGGCCEYAVYHKIRIPLLSEDVPENRHMVFTVDMEIQLEKMIRNGSREQLKQLVGQIHQNFLHHGRQKRHNMEVVRCIVLRCLDEEPVGEEKNALQEKIRMVDNPADMEECIYEVCEYFERQRSVNDDQEQLRLKSDLEEKIGTEYSRQDFNLATLSDWAGIPEKKLYRDFKKLFGVSFSSYLEMLRLRQAQKLLQEGKPVQEVAVAVGYSSDYSFRRAFKRVIGVSPSEYQKLQ